MTYSSVGLYKRRISGTGPCRPRKRNCGALTFYNDTMEVVNSERTIYGINRLLGRRFDDPELQSYIKTLPYKVVKKENKPCIELEFKNGETKLFIPEGICAMILGKMKEIAETYIERQVEYAVILVHQSYLDTELRRHIHEACSMAGLIAYSVSSYGVVALSRIWKQTSFRALVYDLGSSSFNATLLAYDEMDTYEISSFKGDVHLGGHTFDTRLVEYFVNLIKSKYNKDITNDFSALGKLRIECEKAKISLSSSKKVMIKIEFDLVDDDEILVFEETLTREMFEELNMDLFNQMIDLVRGAIEEGGLKKTDIDEIIMVGGSTQIPMIQHLLRNYFGKDTQKCCLHVKGCLGAYCY